MFDEHHRRVMAYALRRVDSLEDAEDVVAETFGVAWRRLRSIPDGAVLPWLLGVARRLIANQRRGNQRRFRLHLRLRERPPVPDASSVGSPVLDALARLPAGDQELLRLLAWDGLTHAEAGALLGITANAVAIRVHRARKRLGEELRALDDLAPKASPDSRTSTQATGSTPARRHGEPA